MLSYALAIAVALSSLVLFSTAFLMSDIHRQDDFLWSGVGLFYALILWFCARNITGAVLLGQGAAATLLVSYNWQNLKLRKAIANPTQASEINNFSVVQAINGLLKRGKSQPQATVSPSPSKVTEQEIAIPDTDSKETASQQSDNNSQSFLGKSSSLDKQNKLGVFGKFFGKKKGSITNTKLDDILEEEESEKQPHNSSANYQASPDVKPVIDEKATVNNDNHDSKTLASKTLETQENETSTVKDKPLTETAEVTEAEEKTIVQEEVLETSSSPAANVEIGEETSSETVVENSLIWTDDQVEDSDINDVAGQKALENNSEKIPEEASSDESEKEPEKSVSSLDSLETVEVAEVLEAEPENISTQRESDQSNIIEVTTTEINTDSEAEKTDHHQDNNSNPA